jgi:hypothetical protein
MAGLNKSSQVVLDATGGGQCQLGPASNAGKATWNVDALLWGTVRAGVSAAGKAPIPRIQIYLDQTDPSGLQAQSYDGSFGSAGGALALNRGSNLIAVWTGGQAGDTASFTVTGTQE